MRDPDNPVARRAAEIARQRHARRAPGGVDGDRMMAAVDLVKRTGADEFQIRFCEEEQPVIWMAAARWKGTWQAAGAMGPLGAVFALLDSVIDGGTCKHCGRPAGFEATDAGTMPMDKLVCWYQYDPGTRKFAKGCAQ
jgi:hypothetical protein